MSHLTLMQYAIARGDHLFSLSVPLRMEYQAETPGGKVKWLPSWHSLVRCKEMKGRVSKRHRNYHKTSSYWVEPAQTEHTELLIFPALSLFDAFWQLGYRLFAGEEDAYQGWLISHDALSPSKTERSL